MRTRSIQFALILLASAALLRSQPAPAVPAASVPTPAPAVKATEPAAAVTVQGTEPAGTGASRTKDTLSVDFPDEDIRTILRNVADLFELNLVIPETMQGKTSIKLRDVTWRQIFEVVLTPIGYTYIEQGSIIKIVSLESLAQEPVNRYSLKICSIDITSYLIPKIEARLFASSADSLEEYREGINTPVTFSLPSASTANTATIAESMPPLNPTATLEKPFLLT